jgi:hypothetical protein
MTAEYTEIMSVRVDAGSPTLYVDLKQNPDASRFLSISEVKHGPDVRSRIVIDEQYVTCTGTRTVIGRTLASKAIQGYRAQRPNQPVVVADAEGRAR